MGEGLQGGVRKENALHIQASTDLSLS